MMMVSTPATTVTRRALTDAGTTGVITLLMRNMLVQVAGMRHQDDCIRATIVIFVTLVVPFAIRSSYGPTSATLYHT